MREWGWGGEKRGMCASAQSEGIWGVGAESERSEEKQKLGSALLCSLRSC